MVLSLIFLSESPPNGFSATNIFLHYTLSLIFLYDMHLV